MGGTSPLKVMCTSNESMRVQCGDSSIQVHLPPLQDTPPPTAYLSRLSSIGVLHACFCTCSKTNNITEVYWGSGQGMGGGQKTVKSGRALFLPIRRVPLMSKAQNKRGAG